MGWADDSTPPALDDEQGASKYVHEFERRGWGLILSAFVGIHQETTRATRAKYHTLNNSIHHRHIHYLYPTTTTICTAMFLFDPLLHFV